MARPTPDVCASCCWNGSVAKKSQGAVGVGESAGADRAVIEKRFRRAGLPTFIEGYSAATDIFTRFSPLLVLAAVAESINAIHFDWGVWANVLVILACAVGVCVGLAALSRWRSGWRSGQWTLLPRKVGWPELAFFVVVPPLITVVAGTPVTEAAVSVVMNLMLLGVMYVVVGYGFVPIFLAAMGRAVGELAGSVARLVRALPLLLVFSLVLFVSTEMWQIFNSMSGTVLFVLAVFFAILIVSCVVLRLPTEVTAVDDAVRDETSDYLGLGSPQLDRRERVNLLTLMAVSQFVQIIVVGLGVALFFLVFGVLVVDADVWATWGLKDPYWTGTIEAFGHVATVTSTHLRVATALAMFTCLYYAITIQTDAEYRREFRDGMVDELGPWLILRAEYRGATGG